VTRTTEKIVGATLESGENCLNILISNASNQPIYEQIDTQINNAIIAVELEKGDAIPSVRQLTKDLYIGAITTKRAYKELERNGFVATVAAKGFFVAPKNMDMIRG
jgi:GntR family transcriptional regulator